MTEAALPPSPAGSPPAAVPIPAPPPAAPSGTAAVSGGGAGARGRGVLAGLDPATRRPTFIVAAIIAGLFFGSQILNEALPTATDQAVAGTSIAIGQIGRITPLPGWVPTAGQNGAIRLEKGVVAVDVFPETTGQNAGDLANAYLEQVLRAGATQLTATDIEIASTSLGSAARFSYQGIFPEAQSPIEGEVTAVYASGHGVIADAWSRQGSLSQLLAEVHEMIDSIEVKP
jgi:hypothetical protein